MITLDITNDTYALVERELARQFRFRVSRKDQSPLTRFLAEHILSRGDIVDVRTFMSRYTTTIPLPFRQTVCFISWDNRREMRGSDAARRIETLGHEAHHVWQMGRRRRDRRRWATGYVMDPTFRTAQEIDAYAVSQAISAHTSFDLRDRSATILLPCAPRGTDLARERERYYEELPTLQERAREAADAQHASLANYFLRKSDLDVAFEELHDMAADPVSGWYRRAANAVLEILKAEWERQNHTRTTIYV